MNADGVVEQRVLTVLQDRGQDWVVSEGLQDGDRVVVTGLQKAVPGATVAPKERAEEAPEERAAPEAEPETATETATEAEPAAEPSAVPGDAENAAEQPAE